MKGSGLGEHGGLPEDDTSLQSPSGELSKTQHQLQRLPKQEEQYTKEIQAYQERISAQKHKIDELTKVILDKDRQGSLVAELRSSLSVETNEKKTWMRKYDEMHQDYLEAEHEARLLRARLSERDVSLSREWERKREQLALEQNRYRDAYHVTQKAAQEREEEVDQLRAQILSLKHDISILTMTEGQLADDVFIEKIRNLGHDLQNWTITNYRKVQLGRFFFAVFVDRAG